MLMYKCFARYFKLNCYCSVVSFVVMSMWCSEPRWLGPCICPESRSEARIPQIPEAFHLLRAGENCRQAHPLLRAQVHLPELSVHV